MPALQCSAVKCMYNKENPGVPVLWKKPECPMPIHADAAAVLFRSDVLPMIVPITDRRYVKQIMCASMEARPASVKKPAVELSGVNKAR